MPTSTPALVALAMAALAGASPSALAGGGGSSDIPTAGELASPLIASNATFVHTFATEGTFTYHCHPHPTMTGVVNVRAFHSQSEGVVEITDYAFTPGVVNVTVGGRVTWTNLGAVEHSVTSDDATGGHGGHGEKKGMPAPGIAAVGLAVAGAAVLAGRRARRHV